jgi:hypothetical protein
MCGNVLTLLLQVFLVSQLILRLLKALSWTETAEFVCHATPPNVPSHFVEH